MRWVLQPAQLQSSHKWALDMLLLFKCSHCQFLQGLPLLMVQQHCLLQHGHGHELLCRGSTKSGEPGGKQQCTCRGSIAPVHVNQLCLQV